MKILAFTAGAARMYCGSCLRDNTLAAELKRQGHDVVLQPLYTPTRTDEENVSGGRVFLNGISVYLEEESAFFRQPHRLLDRLLDARWMIRLASRRSIAVNPKMLGEMTVSMLRGVDGHQLKEIRKLTEWLRSEPAPDIVTLPNSLLIGLAGPVREAVRRPVCCTFQGEELYLSQLQEPYRSQSLDLIRAGLRHVDGFVAVSEYSAAYWCSQLGIAKSQMHVAPLGIHLEDCGAAPRSAGAPFRVGYLARIAPEKGLESLAGAYIRLRREGGFEGASLEAAGYLAPEHRDYLHGVKRRLAEAGLGAEFRYHGELDRAEKIRYLQSLDVLSVPAIYDEPKGLFLLEAMANGVPVVQPRRGAFPEIVEKTGGGILVDPDGEGSLAGGIRKLWEDRALAAELGRRGAEGVRAHYGANTMAARAAEAYRAISGRLAAHA